MPTKPYDLVLRGGTVATASAVFAADVAIDGEFVIRDGRHRLQDEIIRNFDRVQKTLWGRAQ